MDIPLNFHTVYFGEKTLIPGIFGITNILLSGNLMDHSLGDP